MAILTFEVKGQTLTVKSSIGRIVENSINYLECEIKSDDPEWNQENLGKYLVITTKDGKSYEQGYGIISGDNIIKAPGFQVSVIGKKEESGEEKGIQITTQPVFVQVYPSGATKGDGTPGTILPALSAGEQQLIAFQNAVDSIEEILDNKVSDFSSPNNENYPTTKAVSDFVESSISNETLQINNNINVIKNNLNEKINTKANQSVLDAHINNKTDSILDNIADNNKYPTTKATYQYTTGRETSILESLILRDNKIFWDNTEPGWTISSSQKHALLPITKELWDKWIFLQGHSENNGEIAFLNISDINKIDYSEVPPYAVEDNKLHSFTKNAVTKYQIPKNTTHIYVYMYSANMTKEHFPKSFIINGIDYSLGVINNIQSIQNLLNSCIDSNENGNSFIDEPIFSPKYKLFTTIVDNCQDASKWKVTNKSVSAVDTTDYIMWNQSLHCDGGMRSTQNTYDLLKNDLVLKLKINSIETGHTICMRLSNTATPTEGATYYLMTGAQTTPYGDWREIVIPYSGYKYKSNNIDFSAINDIHIYADNVGTSGDSEGGADWNVQYIGLRPRKLNKGIVSFTFDDGYKTQYTGVKLLAEKGITSTVYHIVDATGIGDILTVEELQEMVDYYNADIEVHGDIPRNDSGENGYNALTNEELIAHWSSSQKFLRENGLSEGRHMSYPGNYHSNRVVRLAKKYFDSCRTIQYYIPCESYPPADHHRLRAVTGVGAAGINVATVKKYIDQAMASGAWLILTFHRIGDVPQGQEANASMYCSESDLQAIADYAIESGAIIKNIAEVYNTTSIYL